MTDTLTIRLDSRSKRKLEKLASTTARTKSFLAAEAIRAYVELNEWQIGAIHTALKQADRGRFASPAKLKRVTTKWRVRARQMAG
ncbi:MAG: CopG family ribbon-helix-helix protein [Candidatus Binataceae bacterium]